MSILIVEPDPAYRDAAAEMLHWADGRFKVFTMEKGESAVACALEVHPHLVLTAPELPDMSGEDLCRTLRPHLQLTTFLAYSNAPLTPNVNFDGTLGKPPSRIDLLGWIHKASLRLQRRKRISNEPPPQAQHYKMREFKEGGALKIMVSMIEQPEMVFAIDVPKSSTIHSVIRQLGKSSIDHFCLLRNGSEVPAKLDTLIENDDKLMIHF